MMDERVDASERLNGRAKEMQDNSEAYVLMAVAMKGHCVLKKAEGKQGA